MAKKDFTDPTEFLNELDQQAPQQSKPRSKRELFHDEQGLSHREIAIATGDKTMAGQYKRKQILIPPAQLDFVRDKARELGLSQAALFRWLVDYGLTALEEGVMPEVRVVEVRGEAKMSHWSSGSEVK